MPQARPGVGTWLDDLFEYALSEEATFEKVVQAGSAVVSVRTDVESDLQEMLRAFPSARDGDAVDVRLAALRGLPPALAADFPFTGRDLGVRGRVTATVPEDVRICIDLTTQDATFWSGERRAGIWVMPPQMPEWHWSSPLRQLLHSVAVTRGSTLVHAAMIGNGQSCVLLGGASFSGKSTAVAMALEAGFQTGGDDYVEVVHEVAGSPVAYPVYRILKIRHGNAAAPRPGNLTTRTLVHYAKDIHYLDAEPGVVVDGARPIRALIAITSEGPRGLRPLSAREAVLRLAPSTVTQSIYDEDVVLSALGSLATSVPTFYLRRPGSVDELRESLRPVLGSDE